MDKRSSKGVKTVSPARLSSVNRRVIRTPARPTVRSCVVVVTTNDMRACRWRAVLLRGHFSAVVANPDEVVSSLQAANAPNVIVLDMADPTFDGLALCRALRSGEAKSAIMMLNPQGSLDDLLDGYEAGTDAYLTGNFDHKELFERIEGLSWPQAISA